MQKSTKRKKKKNNRKWGAYRAGSSFPNPGYYFN